MSASPTPAVPSRVTVRPGALAGRVDVPGDKSIGHRALILGALADGGCAVAGLPLSADVGATAEAVRAMGASVELEPGRRGLEGTVTGPLGAPPGSIDCGNSGTALRLLAGVAAGMPGPTTLTGDASLLQRPMGRVSRPLRALGATVTGPADATRAPLTVAGVIRGGGIHRSDVASAQVKSALVLAAVRAGVGIVVQSPLPSRDHTERMLRSMGMDVVTDTSEGERITLGAGTPSATELRVPGDPSSAAFWWAAAALHGTEVVTPGVGINPGRVGALHALAQLGAVTAVEDENVEGEEPTATVRVHGGAWTDRLFSIHGTSVVDAIDELPVLAIVGALSVHGLDVADAAELRVKESDRIAALERLFIALGMTIETRPDGFTVPGGQQPRTGTFDAGLDHRLAMSAAIAATVATGPVTIDGFDSTMSSYPDFIDHFAALGGRIEPAA